MRVATWNVRHGRPRKGFASNTALGHAVHSLDADVVAVQEVDRHVVRSWFADQAAVVAQAADADEYRYAPARSLLLTGSDGIALCVRGDLASVRVVDLPHEPSNQPRVAIVASAVVGEEHATIVATHLHDDAAAARSQLGALLAAIDGEPSPRVLLGDLNLRPEDVDGPLRAAGLVPIVAEPTNPAWQPVQQIDHIAVDGFVVERAWVPAVPVSDHRPLVADLDPVTPGRPRSP